MKINKVPTENLHGYNLQFLSDYSADYLACAASVNYGLAGSGELLVFQNFDYGYKPICRCKWKDAIFDVSWSHLTKDLIATSSGDGTLQIWSIKHQEAPQMVINAHLKEVSSVDWCRLGAGDMLLSSSWDESIRVWNVFTGNQLCIFIGHNSIVYEASWSPHMPGIFASVGGDKSICLWDVRAPELLPQQITAHSSDVLTMDWSLLDEHVIASGGVDHLIKGWDLRYPESPIFQIVGHESAVRRVKFSPFYKSVLASVSYDFSTRFWNWMTADAIHTSQQHTEFVYGLDFSPDFPNKVADCSWDGFIHIYEDIAFNCE